LVATVYLVADLDAALGHQTTQVRIFELGSGKLVSTVAHRGLAVHAEFSPDGRLVATAGKGLDIWDWQKAPVQKGKEYATDQAPWLIALQTQLPQTQAAPLAQMGHTHIRLGTFVDQRGASALGIRRAGFGLRMNELLSAEPVADSLRKAFRDLFLQCGHGVDEEPFDIEVTGVIKRCSVETPAPMMKSWRAEVCIELELALATNNGRIDSKVYKGAATRNATWTMNQKLIEETCSDALADLLQGVAADPRWTTVPKL
jgi:hypothetical protein